MVKWCGLDFTNWFRIMAHVLWISVPRIPPPDRLLEQRQRGHWDCLIFKCLITNGVIGVVWQRDDEGIEEAFFRSRWFAFRRKCVINKGLFAKLQQHND